MAELGVVGFLLRCIFSVVSIFAITMFCLTQVGQAQTKLTLNDYLNAAISGGETVHSNEAQSGLYEAKKAQSIAALMPQIKVLGSYTRQDVSGNPDLLANASTLKLNLTQPVLGLYKNRAAIHVADQQIQAISASGQDNILQLKLAINDAFHAVLSAIGDQTSYLEVQMIAIKRVTEIASRVKIGRSRSSDLFSAQAQLAAADAQLEQSRMNESNARSTLAQISGLPENTPLEDSIKLPAMPEPVDGFLASTNTLPALKFLAAQINTTQAQIDLYRAQRIPDLDLFTNYYLHRESRLEKIQWDVGLQLTWAIYDGGLISGKVHEFAAQNQNYDIQLMQKQRVTNLKIRQLHEQFNASCRQIPILGKSLELAQKSNKSIEKDYRLGLATLLDTIQSFNAVAEAKRQTKHQIINAKATMVALRINAGQTL
jgi:outer membrane protein TolC